MSQLLNGIALNHVLCRQNNSVVMRFIIFFLTVFTCGGMVCGQETMLRNINDQAVVQPLSMYQPLGMLNGELLFFSRRNGDLQLWAKDETSQEARFIDIIYEGFDGRYTAEISKGVVMGSHMYFVWEDISSGRLYRTNGIAGGTEKATDQNGNEIEATTLCLFQSKVLLTDGMKFFVFDGQSKTPFLDARKNSKGASESGEIYVGQDKIIPSNDTYFYFTHFGEFWQSNGTEEGTVSIGSAWGYVYGYGYLYSFNQAYVMNGDTVFYTENRSDIVSGSYDQYDMQNYPCPRAQPNCHAPPGEIFQLDSVYFTNHGSDLYKMSGGNLQKAEKFGKGRGYKFNGKLFYAGEMSFQYSPTNANLIVDNSNLSSPEVVVDTYEYGDDLVKIIGVTSDKLFFEALNKNGELALWYTSGGEKIPVELGTFNQMGISELSKVYTMDTEIMFEATLKETEHLALFSSHVASGGIPSLVAPDFVKEVSSNPDHFTLINENVLYSAQGSTGKRTLYVTPLSGVETTSLVSDELAGPEFDLRLGFHPAEWRGNYYFIGKSEGENRIWKTNGEENGTEVINVLGASLEEACVLVATEDKLVVFGKGVWEVDGSFQATKISDVDCRPLLGSLDPPKEFHNSYFFFGAGVSGRELYRYAPYEGVRLVKDINPGTKSSSPVVNEIQFAGFNYELLFIAHTEEHGDELWKTDGTEQGTVRLTDVISGAGNTHIPLMVQGNSHQFFFTVIETDGKSQLYYTNGTFSSTYRGASLGSSGWNKEIFKLIPHTDGVIAVIGQNQYIDVHKTNGHQNGTREYFGLGPGEGFETLVWEENDSLLSISGNRLTIGKLEHFPDEKELATIFEAEKARNPHRIGNRIFFSGYTDNGWEPHAMWLCAPGVNVRNEAIGSVLYANQTVAVDYQWFHCDTDELVEGATHSTFTPEDSDSYNCRIQINGCEMFTDCQSAATTNGVLEIDSETLVAYPNPSHSGRFVLKGINSNALWQVYSVLGHRVASGTGSKVDLSRQPAGMYLLVAGEARVKLVVE